MDLNRTWEGVLGGMKMAVSAPTFNMYLKQAELVDINEAWERAICTIGIGSTMVRDTLDLRYKGQIIQELERVLGKKCEVIFKIENRRAGERESVSLALPLFEEKKKDGDAIRRANLRVTNTFENYAVGGSNQMAFAAAQAVARKLGVAYNPLFIYGGVGVGKTHLMQAIGHEVLESGETRVLFCPGEEFTNDLVEAIRFKTTDKVRAKYRKVRLLLIDDVQFIAGKPTVQEEFFHTFNALQRDGGQVVMTSDRIPSEIAKLEARLRSRFGAGLIVGIGQPGFELKTAILLIKASQKELELPMNLAQMIAENVEGVRELEGFLARLKTEIETNKKTLSEEIVASLLQIQRRGTRERKIVTPNEIFALVGNYFGVGGQQLKGDRRTKNIVWPRQILMFLLRKVLDLPQEEVGRLVGGRDHSTVIHATEKVEAAMKLDNRTEGVINDLRKRMLIIS